jgi:hypothetical protein
MTVSLVLALLALRSGLALRSARRSGRRRAPDARRRHLARARPAVVLVALGWLAGPASMWWLRGRMPFETAHAWAGTTALVLFLAAAWLGRRLEHGRGRARDAHALAAVLALLAAALAAATGFVLLP